MTAPHTHRQLRLAQTALDRTVAFYSLALSFIADQDPSDNLMLYATDVQDKLTAAVDDMRWIQTELHKTPPADPDALARPMLDATKPPMGP